MLCVNPKSTDESRTGAQGEGAALLRMLIGPFLLLGPGLWSGPWRRCMLRRGSGPLRLRSWVLLRHCRMFLRRRTLLGRTSGARLWRRPLFRHT